MTILALEFSSDRRSVALAAGGRLLAEAVQQTDSRATDALGLIDQALESASLTRSAVEVVVIGLGPGSYTGIRAAIAVAQGWQLATGVKLLGIKSLDAMVAASRAAGRQGRIHFAIDAQRGEFYLTTLDFGPAGPQEVTSLRIVPASEIDRLGQMGEICVGPEQVPPEYPSAAVLALLAGNRHDFVRGEDLEPIYLRETSFIKAAPARLI
ncbi:MAG TPA: tRNA (adenosine(37)-N6)-threonylcarbamoyltransferase complex dimerization subunit type 1 TsaB [Verrucomicrobiae bacterium]